MAVSKRDLLSHLWERGVSCSGMTKYCCHERLVVCSPEAQDSFFSKGTPVKKTFFSCGFHE